MPPDVMIMRLGVDVYQAETEQQAASPQEQHRKRYLAQKDRTAAAWAGIDKRCQFVAQHRSVAPCVPCRCWEEA